MAGITLLIAATLALLWANSPWKDSYQDLVTLPLGLHAGSFEFSLDLRHGSTTVKPEQFPHVGCIGYECDGCDIEWVRGMPIASHRDGTPEGFEILGLASGRMPDYEAVVHSKALFGLDHGFTPWGKDLRQGAAVLGLWTQSGTVLTVGCTEWARQLGEPLVAQITRNILKRLSV